MCIRDRAEINSASLNQAYKGQWRLDKMIGLDVYNQNDEKVGDISEFLVDQTGEIQTAILGVGGFLGVGERLVSVNFDQLIRQSTCRIENCIGHAGAARSDKEC